MRTMGTESIVNPFKTLICYFDFILKVRKSLHGTRILYLKPILNIMKQSIYHAVPDQMLFEVIHRNRYAFKNFTRKHKKANFRFCAYLKK